jgi:hypothetical protein
MVAAHTFRETPVEAELADGRHMTPWGVIRASAELVFFKRF